MDIRTQGTSDISEGMVLAHVQSLKTYKETLAHAREDGSYETFETSLRAPFDTAVLEDVRKSCEQYRKETKVVLLVGIGGSNLGTCALYDALHERQEYKEGRNKPTLISYATVEPDTLKRVKRLFDTYAEPTDITLIVISKSGTTLESITNANILFTLFKERFGEDAARKQTIIIADSDTALAKKAKEENICFFSLPKKIGGRFSIFSTVGLVPLYILGFDIEAFMDGGRRGVLASTDTGRPSSAAVIASFLYEAYLQGARVHEMFIWHPELETLGKWHRQLLAESIGKTCEDGTKIGYTPTIALGSIDLHSVGQLIFGGRNDRFTTFVSSPISTEHTYPQYKEGTLFDLPALEGKHVGEVFTALFKGVQNAYTNNELAFISIELSEISERELGAFMTVHMTAIMYLAKLFDVNAFDQPSVETYKSEVRAKLTKN